MTRFTQDIKAAALVLAVFALLVPAVRKAARHRAAQQLAGRPVAATPDTVPSPGTRSTTLVFPVRGYDAGAIISQFGDKRSHGSHQGVDIKAPRWTPVVAATAGFIERLHEGGSAGRAIYLRAGDGKRYFYAHLEDIAVAEMEAVRAGELIGYVGDSGNARRTTPHLHFEIMVGQREAVDPLPYLTAATVLP
jgi:murein DD-endopeptidase MepM/ murein hydrolase activator NlpD